MEELAMTIELHPKQPLDQGAVESVTRQGDTITRTAADTEVLLPFAQDPDQASTAAPPDDERDLCGREEALRMDEEIMNIQWFGHVTGTASRTCEARRTFNHPQGSSLHNSMLNMPFYVPSFTTTLPHWHQSQPGKRSCSAAGSFLDDLQSMRLRATVHTFWNARLELFWAEDWSALWAMVRAECDIASSAECHTQNSLAAEADVYAKSLH